MSSHFSRTRQVGEHMWHVLELTLHKIFARIFAEVVIFVHYFSFEWLKVWNSGYCISMAYNLSFNSVKVIIRNLQRYVPTHEAKYILVRKSARQKFFISNDNLLRSYSKSFYRKPLGIIKHDAKSKGKTVEEYAEEAKHLTANLDIDLKKPQARKVPDLEVIEDDFEQSDSCTTTESTVKEARVINTNEHSQDLHPSLKFLNFQLYNTAEKKFKNYLQVGQSPKLRRKQDLFLIEGWRLLAEALIADLKPKAIYYSRSGALAQMAPIVKKKERELVEFLNLFPLIKTPYQVLQTWSLLSTSPGITAAFTLSEAVYMCENKTECHLPVVVILDEIRDPTNLGSIVRSMVACGIQKILLMKGCCDLWDMKVLRAACGGHFRACIKTGISWSEVMGHLPPVPSVYLADAKVEDWESEEEDNNKAKINTEKVHKERFNLDDGELAYKESDYLTLYEVDEEGNKVIINESYDDVEHLSKFSTLHLPVADYSSVNYFSNFDGDPLVIVIGGETGLSNMARKFAVENNGLQVCISMYNGVESLNCAVTSSVIAYEFLRQFKSHKAYRKSCARET